MTRKFQVQVSQRIEVSFESLNKHYGIEESDSMETAAAKFKAVIEADMPPLSGAQYLGSTVTVSPVFSPEYEP